MSFVVEYLEQDREMRSRFAPAGFHYKSRSDFVLQHGRQFEMKKKPKGIRFGKLGHCFGNAFGVVHRDPERFAYVEGYAESGVGWPMEHAWVLDREDGLAFDVTWRPVLLDGEKREATDYFGVEFGFEEAVDIVCEKGTYGVLNHIPLMREPWDAQLAVAHDVCDDGVKCG